MQRAIADAQREHLAGRHDLPELVEAYRAGIIEWNRTQLGPAPDENGYLVPRDVLRKAGFED